MNITLAHKSPVISRLRPEAGPTLQWDTHQQTRPGRRWIIAVYVHKSAGFDAVYDSSAGIAMCQMHTTPDAFERMPTKSARRKLRALIMSA